MFASPSFRSRSLRDTALLTGASVIAVAVTMSSPVYARSMQGGMAGGTFSAPTIASDAATQAALQAAIAARKTQDSLARAAKAMQDMQAVQAAARAAAAARQTSLTAPVNVPNGIGAGGLLPKAPETWTGATAPTQSVDSSGQTQVGIRQTSAQAILNWTSFNVGARTTLTFDQQGNGSWVALNRVDATTGPSQILGNIRADGQVYVINQSGIIFGGNSQVNVGSLIASTAGITDDQFKANGIYSAQSNGRYLPSFTAAGGKVVVESGAAITTAAPVSVTAGGGFVLMIGSQVENAGSIATPKGQALLAAGDDFILRRGFGTGANASSTTQGIELAPVMAAGSANGAVTNAGLIFAQQGDITLAGRAVTQNGALIATTSVNTRGTIHLANSASDDRGDVTLGSGSLTAILPELGSADTALDSQRDALIAASATANYLRAGNASGAFDNLSLLADRQDQSRIEIVSGGNVTFAGGSYTAAQGGQIAVSASKRVFAANGATLDVSGVRDVALAMASNNISINVQGNELRDSPQNRDSDVLKSNDVWIDVRSLTLVPAGTGGYASDRYYTAGGLLEVGGYLGTTAHTIGEWSAIGGSITLSAPEVVAQKGATFDLSGGSLDYAAGWIRSTNLIGSDGRRYTVDNAPADMQFVSFAGAFSRTHNISGKKDDRLTEVWTTIFDRGRTSLRWEGAYTVGRDAGSLILSTPTSVFEGTILADTISGDRQSTKRAAAASDGYKMTQTTVAQNATLAIGQYDGRGLVGGTDSDVVFGRFDDITPGMTADTPLFTERKNTAWLNVDPLNKAGLGGLAINSIRQISVDAPLSLALGAQVDFVAPNIAINADLTAHGGTANLGNVMPGALTSAGATPFWRALTDAKGNSAVTIGNGSTIDLSGLWVNPPNNTADRASLAFLDGGTLNVAATGSVSFAAGSTIDVSSGAAMLVGGKTKLGKGGNVSLIANDVSRVFDTNAVFDPSAALTVDGHIIAYGFNGGGTLTLRAGQTVVIGDDATLTGGNLAAGTKAATSLRLAQDVVIPAGGRMPFDYSNILSAVPLDVPLPNSFTPVFASGTSIITAANWVVPASMSVLIKNPAGGANITINAGGTVPVGSAVTALSAIPAGTVIPSTVFHSVIPIAPILLGTYKAGDVVTAAVTLPAGTVVPVDASFDQAVAIQPALALNANLFRSGFSNYAVSSNTGLEIASAIDAAVPVYRLNAASFAAPTGSRVADAADLWLPPTYIADPVAGSLAQRAGASLTFSSLYDFNLTAGSSIAVDPGQSVTIYANRQTTIDGAITAHGGSIAVASVPNPPNGAVYSDGTGFVTPTRSIWIGDGVALDVSAQAVTASGVRGRFGVVPAGGTITLGGSGSVASDAFIIVRPGAVLDASGTSGVIDVVSASGSQPVLAASDGGTIALYSASGMYLDGDLRAAAGGAGASGGVLSLNMLGHFLSPMLPTVLNPFAAGQIPDEMQRLRNVTIVQHDQPTALSAALAPSQRDPGLTFGDATISVDKIHAGGFDQLSLSTKDLFVFSGNVDLAMNRSIALSGGVIAGSAADPHGNVHLAAPYVKLDGWTNNDSATIAAPRNYSAGLNNISGASLNTATDSSFTVDASLIDISSSNRFGVFGRQGSGSLYFVGDGNAGNISAPADDTSQQTSGPHIVDAPGFASVMLRSSGDVRLATGNLFSQNALTIEAAQIYPLSGATATITTGLHLALSNFGGIQAQVFDPAATLTIRANGPAPADAPPSVFGNLALVAPNIDQGGTVRAPLGIVMFNRLFNNGPLVPAAANVVFRSGSITSTSAMGLTIPFGGTSDGVTYLGADGTIKELGATHADINNTPVIETGVSITGQSVISEPNAVLDVSGGGNLLGAGFISGRGGSVNVLTTALVNANPANKTFSAATDKVYAIMPGVASAYAPDIASNGAGNPAIGQQITIPSGTAGVPAGTYTLLPSSYALLPGAYRIELGSRAPALTAALNLANGSVVTSGYLGFANTTIRDALPTQIILTAGQTVRTYSQYNETSYADFLRSQAALFGAVRPRLPIDGGIVELILGAPSSGEALSFDGSARFDGVNGGIGGTLLLSATSGGTLDIGVSGLAAPPGHIAIAADDINAFNAPNVVIGGLISYNSAIASNGAGAQLGFSSLLNNAVNVMDGAVLRAGQIFLVGRSVNVSGGATLDTRGLGSSGVDSTLGYAYSSNNVAVLAVANGWFNFLPFSGRGDINVASGASLLTEGSIVLGAPGALTMGDANLGARYLSVTQTTVNIGTEASLAAAEAAGQLPAGWNLTQTVLDRLLRPSVTAGVPALEQLTIVAGGSVNLFGDVTLDARGRSASGVEFVINSPAIYGLAGAGEGAHLSADAFVWNGIRTGNGIDPAVNPNGEPYGSQAPAPILAGGPGTGTGTLDISAQSVLFGYGAHARATDGTTLNRYAIGFSAVNINASDRVTSNDDGALFVGLSRDGAGNVQGGNLNITAPLITAHQGAVMGFNAGGAIAVTAPAAAASTASVTNLGGTLSFNGDSVLFDTAIALPSGKLTLSAVNDVTIGGHAAIDLSGRLLTFFDKAAASWGGDLVLQSAHGDITQAAGSLIDVSAQGNLAGTITAMATDAAHGSVLFNGTLRGTANGGYAGGEMTVAAQTLGDFAALNAKLNDGGFFGARSFDIKRGDLVIGSEVKAHFFSISVDGGSLSVNGTIDASGAAPGAIRLAARDDLTLASSAVLDAHGTVTQKDSYGAAIDADNTAHIELTSVNGHVTLNRNATIDMRSGDNVSRGKLEINAPRVGTDDIAINAGDSLNISGAASIAVNGFRTYTLPDGGTIDQAYLDAIDADSTTFMNAALGNTALLDRLSGLSVYGSAFHLRPGVEISSDGSLSTSDDLDFATYRYGSGEPGKLVIRAAGDLKINGSITDGFAAPLWTPDNDGFQTKTPRTVAAQDIFLTSNVTLAEDWTIPNDNFYNTLGVVFDAQFNFYFPGSTIPSGTTIFVDLDQGISFGWEAGLTIPSTLAGGAARPVYALAQPLAPGSLSWSMRLVAGADTAAADSRLLRSVAVLNGMGNMTLKDPHVGGSDGNAVSSVIRTGTGDLELLVGGNYTQATPYGIYTAGTSIAATGTAANAPYNPGRGTLTDDGSKLGAAYPDYEATLGSQYMYYMERGGDLVLRAQGNINGTLAFDSKEVGGWLWRQGGAELGQATAWGINFGSYTSSPSIGASGSDFTGVTVHLSTFSGIGTLGGGNVNVQAGGNIGDSGAVVIAIGSSGRVIDGTPVQTGGGTLSIKAGGSIGGAGNQFVDIRGDTNIATGSFGSLYGQSYGFDGVADPRPLDTLKTYSAAVTPGGSFVPGDGAINIRARGDIAMGDIVDPGRVRLTQQTDAQGLQAASWFTLWTSQTVVDLFGAGGSVSPFSASQGSYLGANSAANVSTLFLPSIMHAASGNGDIFIFAGDGGASLMLPSPSGELQLLAAGSVIDTARAGSGAYGPLATSLATLATPLHPAWATFAVDNTNSVLKSSNYWSDITLDLPDAQGNWQLYGSAYSSVSGGFTGVGGYPFVFGANTVSDASAFGSGSSRIYAVNGDILNLRYGESFAGSQLIGGVSVPTAFYRAAKPVEIRADGDIVNLKGLILQNDVNDVSVIAASGDLIYVGAAPSVPSAPQPAGLLIAGPGTLELSAGKNIYQGSAAAIESIGALVVGDKRPGASVVLQAGLGDGTPGEGQVDWSGFARLYLDPANLAGPGALADQPGKVAKTYEAELYAWVQQTRSDDFRAWLQRPDNASATNTPSGATAYFLSLPAAQQHVFLRTIYYAELTAGGREYNDKTGPRPGSYLRGREAIAALFPNQQAYSGSIIAFTGTSPLTRVEKVSGFVHTDAGGDIQLLAPGGGVTLGTEGVAPGLDTGLLTQGQGNIQIFSQDSILLGLSRIMTTFGGDILAWSASGDINAGRGTKTTVVFTPPKRVYDNFGNVTLSPVAPSTGAGIATIKQFAEVAPGNIDLIAPLGTIDAGEAGIRVSGNVNLAALQVLNAANIQVQGTSTGIPTVQAPSISAALSSANATAASQQTATPSQGSGNAQPSVIIVEVLGYGGGDTDKPDDERQRNRPGRQTYNSDSAVQIIGAGTMSDEQRRRLIEQGSL